MDRSQNVQEIQKNTESPMQLVQKGSWGQKEKASALKRKKAIQTLKPDLKSLQNRAKVQGIVREKFSFIDFKNKMMKNSKEKFTFFVVKSEKEFIDTILRRQKEIGDCFLKNKLAIYSGENPAFLALTS